MDPSVASKATAVQQLHQQPPLLDTRQSGIEEACAGSKYLDEISVGSDVATFWDSHIGGPSSSTVTTHTIEAAPPTPAQKLQVEPSFGSDTATLLGSHIMEYPAPSGNSKIPLPSKLLPTPVKAPDDLEHLDSTPSMPSVIEPYDFDKAFHSPSRAVSTVIVQGSEDQDDHYQFDPANIDQEMTKEVPVSLPEVPRSSENEKGKKKRWLVGSKKHAKDLDVQIIVQDLANEEEKKEGEKEQDDGGVNVPLAQPIDGEPLTELEANAGKVSSDPKGPSNLTPAPAQISPEPELAPDNGALSQDLQDLQSTFEDGVEVTEEHAAEAQAVWATEAAEYKRPYGRSKLATLTCILPTTASKKRAQQVVTRAGAFSTNSTTSAAPGVEELDVTEVVNTDPVNVRTSEPVEITEKQAQLAKREWEDADGAHIVDGSECLIIASQLTRRDGDMFTSRSNAAKSLSCIVPGFKRETHRDGDAIELGPDQAQGLPLSVKCCEDSQNGEAAMLDPEVQLSESPALQASTRRNYSTSFLRQEETVGSTNVHPLEIVSRFFFLLGSVLYLSMAVFRHQEAQTVVGLGIPASVYQADDDATWKEFYQQKGMGHVENNGLGRRGLGQNSEARWWNSDSILSRELADLWQNYWWQDLPEDIQNALTTLGYDQAMWDAAELPTTKALLWGQLTSEQKSAALQLGYTAASWNSDVTSTTSIPSTISPTFSITMMPSMPPSSIKEHVLDNVLQETDHNSTVYDDPTSHQPNTAGEIISEEVDAAKHWEEDPRLWDDYDWNELPLEEQLAAATLGYNQTTWDSGAVLAVDALTWNELSQEQQEAASILGYTEAKWDAVAADLASRGVDKEMYQEVMPQKVIAFQLGEGENATLVSRYQMVFFAAALCFVVTGCLDWVREQRHFHCSMILAGIMGIISACLGDSSSTISNGFNSASVHLFLLEAVLLLASHALSFTSVRCDPSLSANVNRFDGIFQQKRRPFSFPGRSRQQMIASLVAGAFFVVSTVINVVLSYFYYNKSASVGNLELAKVGVSAQVFWVMSASIYGGVTIASVCCSSFRRSQTGNDDHSLEKSCIILPNDDGDCETVYNEQN